jgi:uncharacterized lipoprotein YddW (UPF0748 family)
MIFYPYRITGENFNDTASYKQYGKGLSLEDWRRDNVNTYVTPLALLKTETVGNLELVHLAFGETNQ